MWRVEEVVDTSLWYVLPTHSNTESTENLRRGIFNQPDKQA